MVLQGEVESRNTDINSLVEFGTAMHLLYEGSLHAPIAALFFGKQRGPLRHKWRDFTQQCITLGSTALHKPLYTNIPTG